MVEAVQEKGQQSSQEGPLESQSPLPDVESLPEVFCEIFLVGQHIAHSAAYYT